MLTLRPLHADNAIDMADLQGVLEDAPAYSLLVKGRPPLPTDAEDIFNDFPPAPHAAEKLVAGLIFSNQMVGVVVILSGAALFFVAVEIGGRTLLDRVLGEPGADQGPAADSEKKEAAKPAKTGSGSDTDKLTDKDREKLDNLIDEKLKGEQADDPASKK